MAKGYRPGNLEFVWVTGRAIDGVLKGYHLGEISQAGRGEYKSHSFIVRIVDGRDHPPYTCAPKNLMKRSLYEKRPGVIDDKLPRYVISQETINAVRNADVDA